VLFAGALAFVLRAGGASSAQPPAPVVLTHVTVVDTAGGPLRPDVNVWIREGRIARIEKGEVEKGAATVDGRGRFLIPGLCDAMVHLSWSRESALPALLANGVTGVIDMGGDLTEIDAWRTKIDAGLIVGPRIIARAGPMLNGRSFNKYQLVVGTPEETRGVVRTLKQVGVDFLKIHRRLPRDSYFALIDEAKKQGLDVAGHIPMEVKPEEASDVGQAILTHTETLFEGKFSAELKEGELPAAIRRFRSDGAEALFARFAKNGTAETPTLVAYRSIIEAADGTFPRNPNLRYVALSLRKAQESAPPMAPAELEEARQTFAELQKVVRQMHASGVVLLAGTDLAGARVPGFTLHDELALLVEAGLTPLQALQAATSTPAKVLHKSDEFGTIEAGKAADLVLLEADPLQDIRNTRRIAAVVRGGRVLDRGALDRLLRDAEAQAQKN
jgi:imidazolonepropionase-like amidohydrolase